jgi:hypothetical protein
MCVFEVFPAGDAVVKQQYVPLLPSSRLVLGSLDVCAPCESTKHESSVVDVTAELN